MHVRYIITNSVNDRKWVEAVNTCLHLYIDIYIYTYTSLYVCVWVYRSMSIVYIRWNNLLNVNDLLKVCKCVYLKRPLDLYGWLGVCVSFIFNGKMKTSSGNSNLPKCKENCMKNWQENVFKPGKNSMCEGISVESSISRNDAHTWNGTI